MHKSRVLHIISIIIIISIKEIIFLQFGQIEKLQFQFRNAVNNTAPHVLN